MFASRRSVGIVLERCIALIKFALLTLKLVTGESLDSVNETGEPIKNKKSNENEINQKAYYTMEVLDETLEGNYVYIVDEPESEHEGEDVMVYGNVEGEIFGENELQVEVQMMEEQRTDVKGKQILSEHPHVKVNEQS